MKKKTTISRVLSDPKQKKKFDKEYEKFSKKEKKDDTTIIKLKNDDAALVLRWEGKLELCVPKSVALSDETIPYTVWLLGGIIMLIDEANETLMKLINEKYTELEKPEKAKKNATQKANKRKK